MHNEQWFKIRIVQYGKTLTGKYGIQGELCGLYTKPQIALYKKTSANRGQISVIYSLDNRQAEIDTIA